MSSKNEKTEIIEEILKITKADPEIHFYKLLEFSEDYLQKLFTICNALSGRQ
jgi:hypothetical protein